ncbi:NAD-dependent epimerase/dehydratase family protein [Roseitranquillus sediminis]|uniref:NAD-dependent epimerase/dehydratase family protein n=1 Tax=Roseitranquillus sediminis TaxID=2809051 RepID=UPI001D0BF518|nr:NAD-dependent epimerase/dehydratase family protein [Roseitranquillus sediminis]MBM9595172.1 NAD-dependent epimerase/dehydratase family protein [Roseitranquillus sediminis]
MPTALVTGSAGFIGHHVSARLLAEGWRVVGLDALTDYYDVRLKARRHAMLSQNERFRPVEARLEEPERLMSLMAEERPEVVIHLAAQAGVRHSIEQPRSYVEANLAGTFELLEAARAHPPAHMLMASTSSVYGAETEMPYREEMKADTQMSFYAATKKANEAMAHSYAHLYGLPTTMFRFFTVYGPWGRPDMALFKFTAAILEDRPIDVYNHGEMRRDFTYIDDLVTAIRLLIDAAPPAPAAEGDSAPDAAPGDTLSPVAPFRIVNIGNSAPVRLTDFIAAIEAATGRAAQRNLMPIQPGDVPATWADATLLQALTGYRPQTALADGVARFVAWYRDYYGL